jgi:hypothetical protein
LQEGNITFRQLHDELAVSMENISTLEYELKQEKEKKKKIDLAIARLTAKTQK